MTFRSRLSLIIMAPASLCVSVAANAGPPETAVTAPSLFPRTIALEGKPYDGLTGAALEEALYGNTICPSKMCSEIAGNVGVYRKDGVYLEFSDRWEGEGTYAIVNDIVVVELDGTIYKYAYYRSGDGALGRAVVDRGGIIRASRVFAR